MADFPTAVKNALVARLQGEVGAPVFDHVPDGQLPPVVIIDRIDTESDGDKDGGDLVRALVTVQVVAQGRSRDPFRAIVAAVRQRMDGWTPAPGAVLFGPVTVTSSSETTLGDGLTHLGDLQAELFVQPA